MNTICVIGVGNTIRSDDGIGAQICTLINKRNFDGVDTLTVQQLDAELIEDLSKYDHIIIADASMEGEDVAFYPLSAVNLQPMASSHHLNAAMLSALAEKVYGKELPIWICAVKGSDFSIGEQLSPEATFNCRKATQVIESWINSFAG